jgi:hypothetical protein
MQYFLWLVEGIDCKRIYTDFLQSVTETVAGSKVRFCGLSRCTGIRIHDVNAAADVEVGIRIVVN